MRQLGKGLDARHDRYCYAHLTSFCHKVEILLVVVEQLCNGIFRSKVLLLLEILHVHLDVGSFLVLLGVTGYTEGKLLAGFLDGCAVVEEPVVEAVDLLYKLGGVRVAALNGDKPTVFLCLVATKQQQILYAEKL